MAKKSNQNSNDRSKAKTIFNYFFKEVYSMIDMKIANSTAKNWTRGLPYSSRDTDADNSVSKVINGILRDVETAFVDDRLTFYKAKLKALATEIIRYAEEKNVRETISLDIEQIVGITDKSSFIEFCKKCLWDSYSLGQQFLTEVYSSSSLINRSIANTDEKEKSPVEVLTTDLTETNNGEIGTNACADVIIITRDGINDCVKCRREFKIGLLLSQLRFAISDSYLHSKKSALKSLLTDSVYDKLFDNGNFNFRNIRLNLFSDKNLPFSGIAGIGYLFGYYLHMHNEQDNDVPFMFNKNYKTEVAEHINDFSSDCITDKDGLLKLFDEICELSEESQCENILRFINHNIYDNDDSVHATIRLIAENELLECDSLQAAAQHLVDTRKYARATGNVQMVRACDLLIEKINDATIDEDYFQDRRKYKLWASHSLWEDVDYYENLCMDLIEAITKASNTRKAAILKAQKLLTTAKNCNSIERDIQIYERVVFEFDIATDNEYKALLATIQE